VSTCGAHNNVFCFTRGAPEEVDSGFRLKIKWSLFINGPVPSVINQNLVEQNSPTLTTFLVPIDRPPTAILTKFPFVQPFVF
jgi:hypothetical protein